VDGIERGLLLKVDPSDFTDKHLIFGLD
jgi:hypothetical protein